MTSVQENLSSIVYEKLDGQIGRITLNRPESLNAISHTMLDEIIAVFGEAERDDDVKVIVIRGSGRAFSPGHDLSYWGEQYGMVKGAKRPSQRPRAVADRDFFWERYRRILFSLKPKIAQVHGYCLEGAMNLTMLCDIVVAGESAQLGFPGQRLGDAGVCILPLLFNLVGYHRGRELLLTGETIGALKAEEIGLINRAVPDDVLEDTVLRMAKAIALMPIDGIVMGAAYSHLAFESMGFARAFLHMAYGHAWWSNIRFEEGEWNLFKRRSEIGLREALHERDARYEGLLDPDMGGLLSRRSGAPQPD